MLSTSIGYDEDNDIFKKSYDIDGFSFENAYDENGNIIADEKNEYTYDEYGQLANVTGEHNSSYTYDNRGNILTKTVDGETTTYEYNSEVWKDQLTRVNDTELTYDANGNMTSYGDTQFTWSYGKRLESVTEGENTYSYKYDSNGNRTAKTVNGATTEFDIINGTILAQYDGTNNIYFQYVNGTAVGFIHNDTQYLYVTNLNGDIVGITDENGNLLAEYAYDEWGKLLSISADNEEHKALAELNPLRYRGYYYDNETGYYYLQSRYYDPNLGRFISADSFDYIDTSNQLNTNAYVYCWNSPVIFEDAEGTTPQLSIDMNSIMMFISTTNEKISTHFQELLQKFSDKIDKLKSKLTEFGEKARFYLKNPGVFFKETVLKLFDTDIDAIKECTKRSIKEILSEKQFSFDFLMPIIKAYTYVHNKLKDNESNNDGIQLFSNENKGSSEDNRLMAIFQGIIAAIELHSLNNFLEFFGSSLDELAKKSYNALEQGCLILITTINITADYFKNSFSLDVLISGESEFLKNADKMTNGGEPFMNVKGIGKAFAGFISFFKFVLDMDSAGSGAFSREEDIAMASISLVTNILSIFAPFGWGMVLSSAGDIVPQIIFLRKHGYIAPISV